jgi:very-short-patch-repair endonuclease
MKNHSVTYRKTMKTLPLAASPEGPLARREGGGNRVGVKDLTGIARRLRKHSTDTERHLWRHLRDRQIGGLKFRRQQTVGRYVVDFVNFEKKVVVELDGEQHALDPGDKIRDEWLRAEGYKVLRFWDNQVFSNSP